MHDKVTIAIPTLNRAEYLRIALDSALAQSYSNLEVVVSNNACSDQTASVLKSMSDPRLNVLEQQHTLGMMENWNACLRGASGKYFLLLSDDDVLEPTAIEEMVDAFENSERQGKKVGFVYCNLTVIDGDGTTLYLGRESPPVESASDLIVAFFNSERDIWPCATLFRKDDLAPGYDVRFALGADAAQWMRLGIAYGSARFVNRRLARYRVHQNATMTTRVDIWRNEFTALGNFAIAELGKSGETGESLSREIRKAVRRLIARITPFLINDSLKKKKRDALLEYCANYKVFTSFYGLLMLVRGIFPMMLPDPFRAWVRRLVYSWQNRTRSRGGR